VPSSTRISSSLLAAAVSVVNFGQSTWLGLLCAAFAGVVRDAETAANTTANAIVDMPPDLARELRRRFRDRTGCAASSALAPSLGWFCIDFPTTWHAGTTGRAILFSSLTFFIVKETTCGNIILNCAKSLGRNAAADVREITSPLQ
jgi:hypothetical protein